MTVVNRIETQQAAFTSHADWFAEFLKNTDQKKVTQVAILDGLKKYPVWGRIVDPTATLDLLYIGAGTGGLEIPLTQSLKQMHGNPAYMSVHCMDPSEQMKQGFALAAGQAGLTDCNLDYSIACFEDSGYRPPMADFAVASHVWYYIDSWRGVSEAENSLAKFARSINPGGVGLIALQSATSDNYTIRSVQSPKIHGTPELSGEEISEELSRLAIPHQSFVIDAHTDVSSCFQGGTFNPTSEGKLLLSFILRSNWYRPTEDDEVNQQIREDVGRQLTEIVGKNSAEQMIFKDRYMWIPGQ